MEKVLIAVGWCLMMLGASAMDSESVMIPFAMMYSGLGMMFVGQSIDRRRRRNRRRQRNRANSARW